MWTTGLENKGVWHKFRSYLKFGFPFYLPHLQLLWTGEKIKLVKHHDVYSRLPLLNNNFDQLFNSLEVSNM